jgi:copper chaperone
MVTFQVDDMTCGHCVSTITKAVKAADRDATVRIDLPRHLVEIESSGSDADELRDAIKEAGYTPVAAAPSLASRPSAPRGGCCCG